MKACCSGRSTPRSAKPSTVVTSRPAHSTGRVKQERTGFPSRRTVQVPHSPSSQPCFVPARPISSRSTSRRVWWTRARTSRSSPFTLSRIRVFSMRAPPLELNARSNSIIGRGQLRSSPPRRRASLSAHLPQRLFGLLSNRPVGVAPRGGERRHHRGGKPAQAAQRPGGPGAHAGILVPKALREGARRRTGGEAQPPQTVHRLTAHAAVGGGEHPLVGECAPPRVGPDLGQRGRGP